MPDGKGSGKGGKREGAGRKPLSAVPTGRYTVTLPVDVAERIKALGGGNLSAGIRRLEEQSRAR